MDVLDQNEIDALLTAIGGPEDENGKAGDGDAPQVFGRKRRRNEAVDIRPYDFKRPERVSKEQIRALQTLHEGFSRNFGAALSGFLRTIIEVKVANIEQLTYSEFIHSLPNPTSFNLLRCEPLEGQMCLEISPLIIYPIIDRLLGGSNAELFIPQRPLTNIEARLVSKITTRAMDSLSEAWHNVSNIQFKVESTESNPQLVQIVPPNEVVVVVGFELKMGGRAGTMSLCIPFNAIEPVMEKVVSQGWNAYRRGRTDNSLRGQISGKLNRAPLHVSAVLAETTITLEELLNMAPGDVIVTEKLASSPIVLSVEGKKKYLGHLGQFRGNRAMKIARTIGPRDRV